MHGVLLLDKPSGGSSNHALQRVKRLFGARKAGHTGSLDPLATGMLPICLGEATKLAAWLIDADKGYEATLRLGVTTDSADADGEVIERRPLPDELDRAGFEAACRAFEGEQLQVPPMVSAIKVDGQRLYKLAREGVTVERAPRPVTIERLEVLAFDGDTARLSVRCSKGTYIRSLVTDIGERLGCGAHVTSLRRTYVAPFGGESVETSGGADGTSGGSSDGFPMTTLGELERIAAASAAASEGWRALDGLLMPPDAGLGHLPEITVSEEALARFRRGMTVSLDAPPGPRSGGSSGAPSGESSGESSGELPDAMSGEPADAPAAPSATAGGPLPWRVREPSGRLAGLARLSSDDRALAPFRVLQWD